MYKAAFIYQSLLAVLIVLTVLFPAACTETVHKPDPDSDRYRQAVSDFYVSLAASQTDESRFAYNKMNDVLQAYPDEPAAIANLGGSLDLIVANQNGPVKVYRNHVTPGNQWICFKLKGQESNKSAIGVVVRLYWGGKQQKKVVSGGDAFSSQSQRPIHYGLGREVIVEKAEILWPSGIRQEIMNPELNRVHVIYEEAAP